MLDNIITYIHIIATALIIGGETITQLIVYPILTKGQKKITKESEIVKIYDLTLPVTFTLSAIIFATGVFFLFKNYSYFQEIDNNILASLGIKIFIIIMILGLSAYQTFSLRSKMAGLSPFDGKTIPTEDLVKKIRSISLIIIAIIAIALFLGVYIS